jgi:hypothetical protein
MREFRSAVQGLPKTCHQSKPDLINLFTTKVFLNAF